MLGRYEAGNEVVKGLAHSGRNKKFLKKQGVLEGRYHIRFTDLLPCSKISQAISFPAGKLSNTVILGLYLKAKPKKHQWPVL